MKVANVILHFWRHTQCFHAYHDLHNIQQIFFDSRLMLLTTGFGNTNYVDGVLKPGFALNNK
jgi:hypothetical protein